MSVDPSRRLDEAGPAPDDSSFRDSCFRTRQNIPSSRALAGSAIKTLPPALRAVLNLAVTRGRGSGYGPAAGTGSAGGAE
ncbi:MAG: hypothetical protein IT452_11485 [Planctomycetia bacterium]|nr:hypothetical protein [Planctomycetia bacterium]